MKVLYNAIPLLPPLTGVGVYTRRLSEEMQSLDEVESVQYFLGAHWGELSAIPEFSGAVQRQSGRQIPLPKKVAHALLLRYSLREILNAIHFYLPALNGPVTTAIEKMETRSRTQNTGDFVYHETNFVLKPHDGPKVVTIHDLSVLHFPHFHPKERVRFMTRGMKRSLAQADQVITVSEHVRQEVINHYRVDEDRVTAISHAADASYQPRSETDCREVLDRLKLPYRGFLLVVGSVEPRKNLSLLMDAYSDLPDAVKTACPLVHVGPAGWNNTEIEEKTAKLAAAGWFRTLGYVDQKDLPVIFSAAYGLAFPSIYEGFGLPLLEAMSSGTPVLTTNTSSIPEVVGDCGILVDPFSRSEMTEGLGKLLAGGSEVDSMIEAGLARAQKFSWRRAAEETLEVYKRAQAC